MVCIRLISTVTMILLLVSRILTLQFEFMEALIDAQGQIKADEFKINGKA